MEPIFQAHPIPQNVTNFEFHLVGDMTLKQFGYLAAGLGLAFLVFTTLSTVQPLIAWPIIIISALLGVAFAFLPIQDRPLDHWAAAFFRAIFKPTSLKYSSKIISPTDPLFNRRLSHYLKTYQLNQVRANAPLGNPNLYPSAASTPTGKPLPQAAPQGQKKATFIDKFKAGQTSFAQPTVVQLTSDSSQVASKIQTQPLASPQPLTNPSFPPPASRLPPPIPASKPSLRDEVLKPQDLKKTVELAREAQETQQEIVKIEASLSQIKQQAAQPGVDPKSYIEQFEDLLSRLQKLNEQASATAQELAEVSKFAPAPQTFDPGQPKPIAPIKAKSIPTLKLTSFPNVINGIVTDSLGNYIEGAIVVAHDKQGLPVRALKSNKLGQFVAATPLPNGEYAIVVEKDDLAFDKVGLELKNEVLPPILVAAKKLAAAT